MSMAYTVGQIKVLAFNRDEKSDFSIQERNLFLGIAYCYDWFRLHPEDKDDCESLMKEYLTFFERSQLTERK